jgi:aminopeptidase N
VFGTEAGNDYAIGTWRRIKNDQPILGTNTSDKYYKGSAMLHMIRQYIGDTLFRGFLMGLNREFYHQAVNTNQILEFLNEYTRKDFTKTFEQYLTTTQIPRLNYSFKHDALEYRWENCVEGFSMPVKISLDGKNFQFIFPTKQWQSLKISTSHQKMLLVDRNFYITTRENNSVGTLERPHNGSSYARYYGKMSKPGKSLRE